MFGRLYRRLFLEPWQASHARARPGAFDRRVMGVLIATALVLAFERYLGDRPAYELLFARYAGSRWFDLGGFGWWTGTKVLGYLVVPLVIVKALGGGRSELGLRLRGAGRHLWIAGALYLAILPIVIAASYTRSFETTYPFYKLAARSFTDLVAWELLYGLSFLALEAFFRGFLLFALEPALGAYAIFVMIVPYCMIHFEKPPAEAVGAIFAGIVLGTLALYTRSIWCGLVLHLGVAWTMDLLVLAHVYGMPGSGRLVAPF